MRRPLLRLLLPIPVIAVGVGGLVWLALTKPELSPNPPLERVWTVEAATVGYGEVQPQLTLFGEVVAGREVEMRALVAGQVVEVGPGFVDGGSVRAGDLLVAIDPFEYQAILDEQRAQLAEAEARLEEIETRRRAAAESLARDEEQLAVTARDLARIEKLHERGTVSARSLDDSIMAQSKQQQLVEAGRNAVAAENARLEQQRAVIARLEVAVRRARRDLAQTRVAAPFDGFLHGIQAELGKRVGVNDRLARLIDAARLEVSFHLSDAQFGRILEAERGFAGRPASVVWRTGRQSFTYAARVDRVSATIEAASGGVDLYARLLDARLESPVRPGAFVEVRIADRRYARVARLPESVLHGDVVYVIENGRLAPRVVEVAAREGGDILVAEGVAEGERVVTTRFSEIGPGVRVKVP